MATQNMFRTHEGKKGNKIQFVTQSTQMPLTDQITEITSIRAHLLLSYHLISVPWYNTGCAPCANILDPMLNPCGHILSVQEVLTHFL